MMARYDWRNILKDKDEKELIDIYSGNSSLNIEVEIYAGLELKSRDFDFEMIEQIHKKKIEQLRSDIEEYKNLKYVKSKYFKNQITYSIAFVMLLFMHIYYYNQIRIQGGFKYFQAIIILVISLITILIGIPILTAKWRFERYKKKMKKSIEQRTELFGNTSFTTL